MYPESERFALVVRCWIDNHIELAIKYFKAAFQDLKKKEMKATVEHLMEKYPQDIYAPSRAVEYYEWLYSTSSSGSDQDALFAQVSIADYCFNQLRDYAKARVHYEICLKIDPLSESAHFGFAKLLTERFKDHKLALVHAHLAQTIQKEYGFDKRFPGMTDSATEEVIGDIYLNMHQLDEALKHYKLSFSGYVSMAFIMKYGRILMIRNTYSSALEVFKVCMKNAVKICMPQEYLDNATRHHEAVERLIKLKRASKDPWLRLNKIPGVGNQPGWAVEQLIYLSEPSRASSQGNKSAKSKKVPLEDLPQCGDPNSVQLSVPINENSYKVIIPRALHHLRTAFSSNLLEHIISALDLSSEESRVLATADFDNLTPLANPKLQILKLAMDSLYKRGPDSHDADVNHMGALALDVEAKGSSEVQDLFKKIFMSSKTELLQAPEPENLQEATLSVEEIDDWITSMDQAPES